MANVNFKEGTLEEYLNITPDEHTFYKATQDDENEDKVYLGTVQLSNDGIDLQALLDQLQDLEERVEELEDFKLFPGYGIKKVISIIDAGEAEDYWSVGDVTNPIPLTGTVGVYQFIGESYRAMIIGFNHNAKRETSKYLSMTLQFAQNETGVNTAFCDGNYGTSSGEGFVMNTTKTSEGGWESSYMRNTICSQFFQALPTELQNYIGTTKKYSDNEGMSTVTTSKFSATEDKIFLIATSEAKEYNYHDYGVVGAEYEYNQIYDWYVNNSSSDARIRYKNSDPTTSCFWWTRSYWNENDNQDGIAGFEIFSNDPTEDVCPEGQDGSVYSYGFAPVFNLTGSVKGEFPAQILPLNECDPDDILFTIQSEEAANVWSVGDLTAPIELNGGVSTYTFDHESFRAMLIGLDHNMDLETGGKHNACFQFGQTEDGINIAFRDPNYDGGTSSSKTGFRMNSSNTNSGGWESCWMRTEILPEFFEALPAEWQEVISTTTKYTDNVGGTLDLEENITITEDKIFLPAETEIFSSSSYSNSYENNYTKRYTWYANNDSDAARIRYKHFDTSSSSGWWLRSPDRGRSNCFCNVSVTGGADYYYAYYSYGFAPAFTIF